MPATRPRSNRFLAAIAASVAIAATSCDQPMSPPPAEPGPETWAPSLSVVSGVPAVCGDPTQVGLMLGPSITTGSVEVANDESSLYVTYRSDSWRPIWATALFVGDSPDEIPTTRAGLPRLLQFPYRSGHPDRPTEVVWRVPLSDVSGDVAVIAAFAQVGVLPSWGDGEPITPDRDWAMYFTHVLQECGPPPIGPEGGTASAEDGGATLTVPAGALATPAAITITPVTLSDLASHVPPEEYDAELGTVYGVNPIPGTILDLQPDGLEFLTPATIVIHYDESALPEGVSEEDLAVFVVNGVFERLPSVVDSDANTITASIEHFTFAFAGPAGGQLVDLEVTRLSLDLEDPVVGEVVQVTADVRNNGPGIANGATLRFEAQGGVVLGDMDDSCTELADPGVGAVAVRCSLPSLGVGDSESTTLQIIPQEEGTVTISATAHVAVYDSDADGDNDSQQLGFGVVRPTGVAVDLAPSPLRFTGSLAFAGEAAAFQSFVRNWGPGASVGGTLTYRAKGDVVLGGVFGSCSEVDTGVPDEVAVACPIVPLEPLVTTGDIPPFEIVPQSTGIVTVTSTVRVGSGFLDLNPGNDQWRNDFAVGMPGADLEMSGILAVTNTVAAGGYRRELDPSDVRVGPELNFMAVVQNRGSGNSGLRKVTYHALGEVRVGSYPTGLCTAIPSIYDVSVSCDVPGFAPGSNTSFPTLRVIAQSVGPISVWATLDPHAQDWDPANDGTQGTAFAALEGEVDLRPDLLFLGGSLYASIQKLGPDPSLGGTLTLEFFGDVALGDLPAGCTEIADPTGDSDLEVECGLGQSSFFGPIAVSPRTSDPVEIWATTRPAEGQRDTNPADDTTTILIPGL